MKNFRFLTFVLTIATLLLSACGAAAATAAPAPITTSGSNKVAMPVAFVGIVDSIAGDQWVISGTTVTVDASIVRNGPFGVGDRIKVEGFVNPDGSFTVSRVETPSPQDVLTATPFVVDDSNEANANANVNDTNVNDDNSSGINSNDDNSNTANSNDANANINDDHGGNGNSIDDNSNTVNSNDDKGGGSNSNDDNGGGGGSGNSNDDNGNGG